LEFTFDHLNKNCIEDNMKKLKITKEYFGDKVCIGAGTVLTVEEVEKAIKAGAEFIISPNTNIDVIKRVNELGKVSMPGALTPTEAVMAYDAGADYVKLFPAGELGKDYIKALMSPLQHIPFIAVGGIEVLSEKYFMNFINGSILWRNRYGKNVNATIKANGISHTFFVADIDAEVEILKASLTLLKDLLLKEYENRRSN
jgi:Entner-Doudoroff aldolase